MSSKYNSSNLKVFDNEVLEIMFENQLITAMDMQRFAHTDSSLTLAPGLKKKIRQYIGTGSPKEVAMGEGNGNDVFGAYYNEIEYEVGTTQERACFFDEQLLDDPDAVNKMLQHMAEEMTNDMTRKIVKEMEKSVNIKYGITPGFDVISDAIAEFPDESTEREDLFLLVSRADSSAWRKSLLGTLQYVEAYARRGYIGTVCGVPIYWNDAVPQGEAFIGTPQAVTIFVKKGVESESERNADIRRNDVWMRKVMLVALENANKLIMLKLAAAPGISVVPEVLNTNASIAAVGDQGFEVSGFDVVAGVPAAYQASFPLPCNDGIMVNLKGIIPAGGADIIQINPALKPYYEAGDSSIAKSGINYIKTKHYDGSDANYQFLLQPKKTVTISVNGVIYTIVGKFQLV